MIARGSLRFILPPLILAVILLFYFPLLAYFLIGLSLYIIWFFRDPYREVNMDPSLLYAPADGRIVEIKQEDSSIKIAIRMSPFDVHINRSPLKSTVVNIRHDPGTHRSVYFAGAENKNERNLIQLQTEQFDVDILQVTGAFARRIECWVEKNQRIEQGEKIGMIRFGSQTNIVLRKRQTKEVALKPIVKVDQSVRAGLTPIIKIEE